MATLNPRRFAQPDSLKAINPDRLLEFLTPYKEYLAGRGMPWPTTDSQKIDYETLAGILMKPDDQMPTLMVDGGQTLDQAPVKPPLDLAA